MGNIHFIRILMYKYNDLIIDIQQTNFRYFSFKKILLTFDFFFAEIDCIFMYGFQNVSFGIEIYW
jgi:hypothetical protein